MSHLQCPSEEQCSDIDGTMEMSYFTVTFSFILLVLNIPANLLVILAVALDPYKNLRTPFNYLMANLAFADLLVGTVTEPLSIHLHWKKGVKSHAIGMEADMLHMSYFISSTASVLSLGTLAVERYLALTKPHTYRNKFTNKRILGTVAGIWFISLSLPWLCLEICYVTYTFIFTNTVVAVSFVTICVTYFLMLRVLKQRSRSDTPTATLDKNLQQNVTEEVRKVTQENQISNAAKWEHKITKRFLLVLIALLCCYGPSGIFIYAMNFCKHCSCIMMHWFRDIQLLLVLAHSNVNFFCYALRSSRFRVAFARLVRLHKFGISKERGIQNIGYSTDTMKI